MRPKRIIHEPVKWWQCPRYYNRPVAPVNWFQSICNLWRRCERCGDAGDAENEAGMFLCAECMWDGMEIDDPDIRARQAIEGTRYENL